MPPGLRLNCVSITILIAEGVVAARNVELFKREPWSNRQIRYSPMTKPASVDAMLVFPVSFT
jgi:hypothetical protein